MELDTQIVLDKLEEGIRRARGNLLAAAEKDDIETIRYLAGINSGLTLAANYIAELERTHG